MSTITTYTGMHIDPLAAVPEQIEIRDIAHALSLLCRGNGHVKHFYSVGLHSVNACREAAARGHSRKVQLACLLHDASEAYLADVPRPMKASMPEYRRAEEELLEKIFAKYLPTPLTAEERAQVSAIDNDLLAYDLRHLLNDPVSEDDQNLLREPDTRFLDPAAVEQDFLRLFAALQ